MTRIEQIRQALSERPDVGRTHWDGCEVDQQHRDCAIRHLLSAWDTRDAAIEELVARLEARSDAAQARAIETTTSAQLQSIGLMVEANVTRAIADALDAILKETTP